MSKKIEATRGRGRPAAFENKEARLAALVAIRDNVAESMPSNFLTLQLVEAGLVVLNKAEPTGKRGRPALVPTLTGKAKSIVTNALKRAAKAVEPQGENA